MSRFFRVPATTSADAIKMGSPAALNNQEPFTITCWAMPITMGAVSGGRILCKDTGSAAGLWQFGFPGGTTNNNALEFTKDYATTDLDIITATNVVTLSQWNHCAVSWDGNSSGGVYIYINSVVQTTLATSTTGVGAKNSDAALTMVIGNRGTNGTATNRVGRNFHGELMYTAFHNRVLSINEINQIRYFPGSVSTENMHGFWRLLTGSSPEDDDTSFQNPGTVSGPLATSSFPPICGVGNVQYPLFAGCG